jgi:YHS domain-containing protein
MIKFLVWIVVLFVLWRLGWRLIKGVLVGLGYQPPPSGPARAADSVGLVRDPVCGTFVMPAKALTSGSGSDTRYFCSDKCRRDYGANRS